MIRILHVVGGMNRGGVETWLMHVLRHIDRARFQMDFLVHTDQPCAYDDEIRALGSRIIPCLGHTRPWQYAHSFRHVLRDDGPYDVVHSHVHHFSGYVLWLARQAGVPVRIAHSHNDTSTLKISAGWARGAYLNLTERLIHAHATLGLAASRQAAAALFGADWEADPRWRILYYGIDLAPFRAEVDSPAVRAELGIPPDAFVVGHVGRFVEQKNHTFLLDIAAEIIKCQPRAYFLLVGDGPLRPAIERKLDPLGLKDRVVLTGVRPDVPRLMMGAMDVFLMPSQYEGLPIVVIEAQAAGLVCVISDCITEEVGFIEPLVTRLPFSEPPTIWASTIFHAYHENHRIPRSEAVSLLCNSPFNIRESCRQAEDIYCG